MKEFSRQFKRRMERLGELNIRKYGSIRKCLFDEFPCERKPSQLDGDRECGGATYSDGVAGFTLIPPCSRFPFKESLKGVEK